MREGDRLRLDNETLRARLTRLTEAVLRISEDLDLDTVLQEVVDNAMSLTDAQYSAITIVDSSGELEHLLISGLSPEEKRELLKLPQGWDLLRYLTGFETTFRTDDLAAHTRSVGFPGGYLPMGTFLGTRIRDGTKHIGNIYLGEKDGGADFTPEDEETLEMFATQAAMAITNARRYEEERRAKADLEALINTSPVGVLVVDAESQTVVKFNEEARRITGGISGHDRRLDHLLSLFSFLTMDGRSIPNDELPMLRAMNRGETVRAEQIIIELPSGERVTTLVNATPINSEDDEILSVVVTVQDMTPLAELERLRADFLGMVSHELRAPLTSIKGSAATVRGSSGPLDPAEILQFFRIVEEQADHMRDLINNLLDLTRIEAGTLSVALEPIDLVTVIEQARNAFLSSGYRNTVEVALVPELPRIEADRQRIAQVLYNLFTNASKYSREWSPIRVNASHGSLYVEISVWDEGIGIPSEHLSHLFSKFSRLDEPDVDRRTEGYGLGLAICKGIVEAHGGRIWAESEGEGQGTKFTFTLPAAGAAGTGQAPQPTLASKGTAKTAGKPVQILALDDDPQTLWYLRNTLTEAGYRPILTSEPADVEHIISTERPDLVLLNVVLPGTHGFDLMKRIGVTSDIPVIFLSGRGGGEDIARAFELGAADYVVKPFSPPELIARIDAALKKQALFQQSQTMAPYMCGDLVIDYVERRATVAGSVAPLTPTEYNLLYQLSTNAGRVLTHDQLIRRIWGHRHAGDPRVLRSFVKTLRNKLGDDARNPSYIFTEAGVGYSFARP